MPASATLREYKRKRDFHRTREPQGKSLRKRINGRIFVVQKHHAKRLHYDFRLELEGVLKSWAVPKGLSLSPNVKRLAVQTEDHPLSYAKFTGTIPPGEYGAGEVVIWDHGTWVSEDEDPVAALEKGQLKFRLLGKKLKARFVLLRTANRAQQGSRNWLLIRLLDQQDGAGHESSSHIRPISSPSKVIFEKEGITKKDVADFYQRVAKLMLPHVANRPLTLVRCPNGARGSCFIQKHLSKPLPKSFHTFPLPKKRGEGIYLSVDSAEGLRELVQLNAYELHAWNCRYQTYLRPDQIVMDLDPGPGVAWPELVQAAFELKELLEESGLKSFVKLSGGKGLHLHIPIAPLYSWDQILAFSRRVAKELVRRKPKKYTNRMSKKFRREKVFVDYLRNSYGATAVVPYSLRAQPVSAVALPLEWRELRLIKSFPVFTMPRALKKIKSRRRDPWREMLKYRQELVK